jgi:hypothetical protein
MSAPARPRIPSPADLAHRNGTRPGATTPPEPAAVTHAPDTVTEPAPAPAPKSSPAVPASSVAGLVAPGRLLPHEILRRMFQHGLRISRMRPEARLTALTLLGYANYRTGLVNKHLPDTKELAYATGLTEGQVLVQIEVLTQRGWLTHRVLGRGPREGLQVIQLCVPAHVLQQLRDRQAADS